MDIFRIPPLDLTCGLPFSFTLRVEDPTETDPVISLTGATATFLLADMPHARGGADGFWPVENVFHRGTGTIIDDGGRVRFDMTADETAALRVRAPRQIGGIPTALLQVDLTIASDPVQPLILQGTISIIGAYANA